jgi:hypothetical protein
MTTPATDSESFWPCEWRVKLDNKQDRWTIRIPRTTAARLAGAKYQEVHGTVPPQEWAVKIPEPYATVSVDRKRTRKRPIKKVTLKTDIADGSEEDAVTLAPSVFGRGLPNVTVTGGKLSSYRRARLLTSSMTYRIVSIVMGVVGGAIAAAYTIGGRMAAPYVYVSPSFMAASSITGAALAALAPVVLLVGDKWFNDSDIPNSE